MVITHLDSHGLSVGIHKGACDFRLLNLESATARSKFPW